MSPVLSLICHKNWKKLENQITRSNRSIESPNRISNRMIPSIESFELLDFLLSLPLLRRYSMIRWCRTTPVQLKIKFVWVVFFLVKADKTGSTTPHLHKSSLLYFTKKHYPLYSHFPNRHIFLKIMKFELFILFNTSN